MFFSGGIIFYLAEHCKNPVDTIAAIIIMFIPETIGIMLFVSSIKLIIPLINN